MTAEDERILSDPRSAIIATGGAVLVAVSELGVVIGVVAVLAMASGVYELAKMTVDVAARGTGTGRLLISAAVDWARANGGRLLFLGTNTRLEAAIRLYEQAGFTPTTLEDLELTDYYARADLLMKLQLA
jgi:GNAT superfamily N-acetyltransferase